MSEITEYINSIVNDSGAVIEWRVGSGVGDGFSIEQDGDKYVVTANNERSCLWGILHLRESGGTGKYEPRFAIRGINVCESLARHTPKQICSLLDAMMRWRMNRLIVHVAYGYKMHCTLIERLCRQRGIEIIYYLQTSLLFLDNVSTSCFAKDNQGNLRTPALENRTRLCASNEQAREAFLAGARRYFAGNNISDKAKLILIDADDYLICQCPKCRDLGSADQWNVFFSIAMEEAGKSGKQLDISYLSYVWRYTPPAALDILQRSDMVVFDTHQRCRWVPLGEEHSLSVFNKHEAQGDPRAADVPLNKYLLDRLKDWRRVYKGNLVVFENLMIQGSISCPQPYTQSLLEDLITYEKQGVDGVIYEAFEPGMESFAAQITALSQAMWTRPAQEYNPSLLEQACNKNLRWKNEAKFDYKNQFNVLEYLTTDQFDGLDLLEQSSNDSVLYEYTSLLRRFLLSRSLEDCAEVIHYVLAHQERLDWVMIGFNLLRAVEPGIDSSGLTEDTKEFLQADKLWDWMESHKQPLESAKSVLEKILECLACRV